MTTDRSRKPRVYQQGTSDVSGLSYVAPSMTTFDSGAINLDSSHSFGAGVRDWKLRIKQKQSATTSFDAVYKDFSVYPSVVLEHKRHYFLNGDRSVWFKMVGFKAWPSETVITGSVSTATNDAFLRFVSRARSSQRPLSGLLVLGELKETIALIRSPGKALSDSLYRYLSGLKRPKRRLTAKQMSNYLSGKWLEYRFGILPLLSDIDSGMLSLSRIAVQPPDTIPVSASAVNASYNMALPFDDAILYTGGAGTIRQKGGFTDQFGYARVKIYGAIKIDCGPLVPFGLSGKQAFLDFVPTVWELIPYSFLIDYFSNIGSVIESLSLLSSSVAWCNRGYKLDSRNYRHVTFTGADSGSGTYHGVFKQVTLKRETFSVSTYVPSIQFKLPGSSTRWTNIAALGVLHGNKSKTFRL